MRRVVVRFLERVEASLDRRDPLLERAEAAELLLHRVDLLAQRRRLVDERLRRGQICDPPDDLLTPFGEPRDDVFLRLSHRVTPYPLLYQPLTSWG